MKNRIRQKITFLKKIRKKALVAYITAGYPELKTTEKIVELFAKNNVDFIELGMPFSDPIADGPIIQKASNIALKRKMNLSKFLVLVKRLRKKLQIPLIMMTYYNPIFKYGLKRFAHQAKVSGLDGLIVPDLPPEEAQELLRYLKQEGLALIFLVSPITPSVRIKKIAALSDNFLYYVSLTGVTGIRNRLPIGLFKKLGEIKKITPLPIYVGFGVSNPKQVKKIVAVADGVIVGSAIIKIFEQNLNKKVSLAKIKEFIVSLRKATS